MEVSLGEEQASELLTLVESSVGDMSHEIAATDNSQYRAGLIDRRTILQSIADQIRLGSSRTETSGWPHTSIRADQERVWTVEVVLSEDEEKTRADARMRAVRQDWHGWGRSRRNPIDPDVPAIGEELAAARALSDLSHQLIDAAARGVETFEGHPVRLHV